MSVVPSVCQWFTVGTGKNQQLQSYSFYGSQKVRAATCCLYVEQVKESADLRKVSYTENKWGVVTEMAALEACFFFHFQNHLGWSVTQTGFFLIISPPKIQRAASRGRNLSVYTFRRPFEIVPREIMTSCLMAGDLILLMFSRPLVTFSKWFTLWLKPVFDSDLHTQCCWSSVTRPLSIKCFDQNKRNSNIKTLRKELCDCSY